MPGVSGDLFWLLVSYLYVAAVLLLGTLAARLFRSADATRKVIHVGVGSWIIPTTLFFQSPWMAMIPPASFVLANIVSYRFRLVRAMEGEGRNPGTIYFPLAFVLLVLAFWPGALTDSGRPWAPDAPPGGIDGRFPVAAGIMVMAWGDAAASIFGRRFGRRRWRFGGGERSVEGTAAFLLFGWLGVMAAGLALGPAGAGAPLDLALRALAVVLPAAAVEAVSPRGLDNLSVPIMAATAAALLVPGR
jgi:dolichol kinase